MDDPSSNPKTSLLNNITLFLQVAPLKTKGQNFKWAPNPYW